MSKPRFLRRDWNKKSRLGKGRRNKMVWRKAKGRHSKIRQKWKGYSQQPSVGYKSPKKTRGFVQGKKALMIYNIPDLEKIKANEIGIISSKIGNKKRMELAKKSKELGVSFANFNAEKFLEEIRKKSEESKEKPKTEEKEKKETETK